MRALPDGSNFRMRNVWRPTTSSGSTVYVVTQVTNRPRPIRVRFSSEIESKTVSDDTTSPRRR